MKNFKKGDMVEVNSGVFGKERGVIQRQLSKDSYDVKAFRTDSFHITAHKSQLKKVRRL